MEDVFTLGLRHERSIDDFNQLRFALYGGLGESEIGEDSWFAGAGFEYEWRENGLEPGGSSVRWRTELIRFLADNGEHDHGHEGEDHDEDHDDDHGDEDHGDDHGDEEESMASISSWGFTSEVLYIASDRFHPFVRIDYADGSPVLEAEDWTRYTAGATIPLVNDPAGLYLKLQANFDERGDESEESFWAQLGFSWGGKEVR